MSLRMNETYQYKTERLNETLRDLTKMPPKDAKTIEFNNVLNTPKKTVNKFLTARINPNLNGILSKEEGT